MSTDFLKNNFVQLLEDKDNKVIALTGKWGIGKTFFLRHLKEKSSEDSDIKNSLYASLFGIKEINELKRKLAQDSVPYFKEDKRSFQLLGILKKRLENINQGFKILDDLVQFSLPDLIGEKVIIIDDIERKHEKLDIDELFGFIDEYVNKYNSRFILVFNAEKLKNIEKYKEYYEKIIEDEIHFNITPEEAFEIATKTTQLSIKSLNDDLKKSIEICEIRNIRVIKKIIKIINKITRNHNDDENIIINIIPSSVLHIGNFYKGIENIPSFDEIKHLERESPYSVFPFSKKEDDINTNGNLISSELRENYKNLKTNLKILSYGEYEELLIKYLEHGELENKRFKELIDSYLMDKKGYAATSKYHEIIHCWNCNQYFLPKNLEEMINEHKDTLSYLNVFSLSDLIFFLEENNISFPDNLVNAWKENTEFQLNDIDAFLCDIRKLHPKIKEIFEHHLFKERKNYSLIDAIEKIYMNNTWGTIEEKIINTAEKDEFVKLILTDDSNEFRRFIHAILSLAGSTHFQNGIENFYAACKEVYVENKNRKDTRISSMLFSYFKEKNILEKLTDNDYSTTD